MATVKPLRAIRPKNNETAEQIAELPYDVMSSEEARIIAADNPLSFLHVDKAEIDLSPSVDIYDPVVYAKAKENFDSLISGGALIRDPDAAFYVYRLTMGGRSQAGIVGCASADDYLENRIKKHEFTRADKEEDRVRHVDTLNANTGPIFLAHRPNAALSDLTASIIAAAAPIYDFEKDGGVRHEVWKVTDPADNEQIAELFRSIDALYIADGHHRCASAARVAKMRREANPGYTGDEEFNYFLAVIFPSDQLAIMDYNRLVRDLNGLDPESFEAKVLEKFEVRQPAFTKRPERRHEFGLYMGDRWQTLRIREEFVDENDPVARLDVSLLQENLLGPILGIEDPRTDKRIDFAGGIRGLEYLEERAGRDCRLAFAMYPTSMEELMDIADAGKVMPPKSTWFEPKLLSGLFSHSL
ncbi:MAG: DUF1015 family protein [Clostridiales Family XIII bacterium]|jgi:uncharacterized protein (DUF1015 family)|nr:DUF1015 family protein [Clostridiales Family XIII bacterium]